jgi:pimeloyl-ACP methyl ester carboxylesterase
MVKKTLLSLAVAASAVGMAGCQLSSVDGNEKVDDTPVTSGQPGAERSSVSPIFSPANSLLPPNIDLLFAQAATTDGTAQLGSASLPPEVAINKLPGFSTTAAFYLPFNGALNADSVAAGSTVFLVKLKNQNDDASIDPLDITSIVAAFPENPIAEDSIQSGFQADYVELADGTHTIRIMPTEPLDPRTKYIVALTDGIMGADGLPVRPSADYELLSGELELPSSALAPVREAVKGWEQIAGGFLAQASSGALTQDNVIMSYAFTTNSDSKGLTRYAAPALFVKDQLPLAQAEGLLDGAQPGTTDMIAAGVVQAGGGNPTDPAQVAAAKQSPQYEAALYNTIISLDEELGLPAGLNINSAVRAPAPRSVDIIDVTAAVGAMGVPANTLNPALPATASVYQGQIQLPNFLDLPMKTSEMTPTGIAAAMSMDADWEANTGVGAILDGAFGNPSGTTPPKDADGSTNVTWRYPFPQPVETNNGMNYAPLMVTLPNSGACGEEVPVVMFVHGITSNRASSLAYASNMAANCVATVAIDLPLHGIAPVTSNNNGQAVDNSLLAFSVDPANAAFTGSPWAGVAAQSGAFPNLQERHGNIYQDGNNIRKDMVFDASPLATAAEGDAVREGTSGSTFINLSNFTRTRDNMQQAVVDLLNLNASLDNIDNTLPINFDLDKVYVAGHSLGAILGTTYAAVNNDASVLAYNQNLNRIQGVILANGGTHVSKLLENSIAFGPTILGGLKAAGVEQGTANFETFMHVIQATIDVVDPANSAQKLAASGTPVALFNMVGGAPLPADASAVSFPDALKVAGVFLPDHTVPNYDYFGNEATNPYAAFAPALGLQAGIMTAQAPMVGTTGQAQLMGLDTVNAATDVTALTAPVQVQVRFNQGTHSTFAAGDVPAAFGEMVRQSLMMVNGAYNTAANTLNTSVLESN